MQIPIDMERYRAEMAEIAARRAAQQERDAAERAADQAFYAARRRALRADREWAQYFRGLETGGLGC